MCAYVSKRRKRDHRESGHFWQYKVLGNFPTSPSNAPPVLPFSVTVRYGRATCHNHVIYDDFATVSLWGWASHSYLFRGVLNSIGVQQYIHIAYKWRAGSLDPGVPLVTPRPYPFSLRFPGMNIVRQDFKAQFYTTCAALKRYVQS